MLKFVADGLHRRVTAVEGVPRRACEVGEENGRQDPSRESQEKARVAVFANLCYNDTSY